MTTKDFTNPCPCGSTYIPFVECCCREIIAGTRKAETAAQLLRARYVAFATGAMGFVEATMLPQTREGYDGTSNRKWAETSVFTKFVVLENVPNGTDAALVSFEAHYTQSGRKDIYRARSRFERVDGEWFFVSDETLLKPKTVRHEQPKLSRNALCSCGSGKKYKKCCSQ